ncbi:MAG: hypothetical protein M3680_09535, partial [Myxococcota bacterium]|nr:hypothetical protein [Myxococcota bacterium]
MPMRACRGPRAARSRMLRDASIGGGNFRLRFASADRWARVFAYVNHERRRLLRIYYGDSGLFVRRSVYEQIGGYRDLPIMEDYDLVRRLERATRTAYLTDVEIVASRAGSSTGRRPHGGWRAAWTNKRGVAGASLGRMEKERAAVRFWICRERESGDVWARRGRSRRFRPAGGRQLRGIVPPELALGWGASWREGRGFGGKAEGVEDRAHDRGIGDE